MPETNKKNLNLSVEEDLIKKAREQGINISEITEKVLRVFTTSSENVEKEKMYKVYQELFHLILPLLKKFQVETLVGQEEVYAGDNEYDYEIEEEEEPPVMILDIFLEPNGTFSREGGDTKNIRDIPVEWFLKPKAIVDKLLLSIQKGVEYRKNQFKEIEMAKTIIDAITKTTLSKRKRK